MKYVKLFEQFIAESGNSVEDAKPFQQDQVKPTLDWIKKNVFPVIGLTDYGDDAAVIGSAGKKAPGDTSGDIDIAVSADKIAGHLDASLQNVLEVLDDMLKSRGFDTKLARGFNQVSIGAPIAGDPRNGVGQVDLMLSTDMDWSRFIYHSPDFSKGESKYKGAYRNMLLMSAIGQSFGKTLEKTPEGQAITYQAYVIRLNQGIVEIRKSFMGKKGLVKTAKLLREYDREITREPQEVVDLLFNGNHTPQDIDSYEKLKSLIDSSAFKFPEKVKGIMDEFKSRVEISGLPLPSDIA
jgi:hypothetical protein